MLRMRETARFHAKSNLFFVTFRCHFVYKVTRGKMENLCRNLFCWWVDYINFLHKKPLLCLFCGVTYLTSASSPNTKRVAGEAKLVGGNPRLVTPTFRCET